MTFILKDSPNIQYSTRYWTRYSTSGRVTQPQFINFTIRLRLNLGHPLLVFALTTNLESGPRFANICKTAILKLVLTGLVNRHLATNAKYVNHTEN